MNKFLPVLIELALLALIVVAMAASIYILRRSNKFLPPALEEEHRRPENV